MSQVLSASFIAHRRLLSQRSEEADDRSSPGRWKADLMLFGNHWKALLVLQERHPRLLATVQVPGKAAEPVARPWPSCWRPFPPGGAARWPWKTAPSSPGIARSINWGSKHYYATYAPTGRGAGWETASAGCAAICHAGRSCRLCQICGWPNWPRPTTPPRASAWAASLHLKSIPIPSFSRLARRQFSEACRNLNSLVLRWKAGKPASGVPKEPRAGYSGGRAGAGPAGGLG